MERTVNFPEPAVTIVKVDFSARTAARVPTVVLMAHVMTAWVGMGLVHVKQVGAAVPATLVIRDIIWPAPPLPKRVHHANQTAPSARAARHVPPAQTINICIAVTASRSALSGTLG